MMSRTNITGMRFGKLVALEETTTNKRKPKWLCQCDCGAKKEIPYYSLCRKDRPTRSCGCIRIEKITKHACWDKNRRLYRIWTAMKQRCYNTKSTEYFLYGGRGINICECWLNDYGAFYEWAMSNGYDEDLTIERNDVNGNYEPQNCRWATRYEQSKNRRTNVYIAYKGRKKIAKEIDKEQGFKCGTIARRLRAGWNEPDAISTEPSLKNSRRERTNTSRDNENY